MNEAQRVKLERRISEERMTPIDVGDGQHDTLVCHFDSWQPRAWAMNADGEVAPQCLLDEVDWHGVVAIRLEQTGGYRIDVDAILSDDFELDEW